MTSRRPRLGHVVRNAPYPFDSQFVRGIVGRFGLPVWFAALQGHTLVIVALGYFGLDARIYARAAHYWIAGGDPWSAAIEVAGHVYHFAAPPINLVPLAPIGLLSEAGGTAAIMITTWLAAIGILRRLNMQWWWLLFPPMTEALVSGNPSIVVLWLLVSGPRLAALAGLFKIYAWIPATLLGGVRAITFASAAGALGILLSLPLWPGYLGRFSMISARLVQESNGGYSAWSWPLPLLLLVGGTVLYLLVANRRLGAWLAVPALWPASELHYATLGMPVMAGGLPWVLAIPLPGVVPATVVGAALWDLARRFRHASRGGATDRSGRNAPRAVARRPGGP